MTKYYCDFCQTEITEDLIRCQCSIHGFKGLTSIWLHGHRQCFVNVIGYDVVKKAEEDFNEREKKRKSKKEAQDED